MGVRVQIIKGIYYLAITHNGARHYESLHIKRNGNRSDRELDRLAEMCRLKREMQLLCSDFELPDTTGSKIALYDYMESIGREKSAKNHYTKCLKYLGAYPEGKTIKLKDLTTEWLSGFQTHLLKTDLSHQTVKHYMDAINCTLNQAIRERKLASNPARNLPLISVKETLLDVLTMEDIQKLDSTPLAGVLGAEARRAFLFACFTGLRISDIRDLKWRNIDGDKIRIVMHKTGRFLEIPMHENAKKYIEKNDSEFVFPLVATTTTNCLGYFDRWARSAGISKKIGWHTARRSFATIAVECGIDQYVISKLLGHTSMRHTATYSQVPITVKKDAVKKIPPIRTIEYNKGN